jgi:hypothetical protein
MHVLHGPTVVINGGEAEKADSRDVERGNSLAATQSSADGKVSQMRKARGILATHKLPPQLAWILPVVTDWSRAKPVLRSALAAWICMLFMLVDRTEEMLGTASFLILVGVFIQPAELPLAGIVEREFFTMLLTCTGWAYVNLATFLAHLARQQRLAPAETDVNLIFDGVYIETAPTAICTAFLAVGVACTLYLKVKFGPSPFIFATILTCICLDIALVYAPFYPYPNYQLGKAIVLPLAIKAGVVILMSCVFFPKSVNSAFVERLLGVLQPLSDASQSLKEEMRKSPLDPEFDFELMRDKVAKAEAGLLPLLGQARLVMRELSFSLASGEDLKGLVGHVRSLLAPADGVAFYFSLIKADLRGLDFQRDIDMQALVVNSHHASHFTTPTHTRPASPMVSRPPSPTRSQPPAEQTSIDQPASSSNADSFFQAAHSASGAQSARRRFGSRIAASIGSPSPVRHSLELRKRLHELTHSNRHREHDVGIWESLRYSAFETQFHGRANDHITDACMRVLAEISADLLTEQVNAIADLRSWLLALNKERTRKLVDLLCFRSTVIDRPLLTRTDGSPKCLGDTIDALVQAIAEFKQRKHRIVELFRASVEPQLEGERLPHRYLFQCLTFCHFQVVYTSRLVSLLRTVQAVEAKRKIWKIWWPKPPSLFHVDAWQTHDGSNEADHDEDPDAIPGMASTLGETKARDPDALDSDSRLQDLGIAFSRFLHQLYRGNSLFMIKVGMTTVLVALPSILRSSAGWAYRNKAIWTVIMSQFVSARHRGEVLFGLFSRVIATFVGAIGGLLIWYIASGNGVANPYAMAAVTAVAFPIVMAGRINYPGPPITPIITCVTVALIVGYSWKDAHNPTPGSPGIGWDVAWRRFLEVIIGASASYIVAILPPSSSMRTYFRLSHATTIRETGGLFCEVVYLAAAPVAPPHEESRELLNKLIAVRTKIRRLAMLKGAISYEWSLRGKWPMTRYEHLERIELRILRLLTHAVTIYETLGPLYSKALLKRTHFLDPTFLADCIAVFSMCTTSLSTGQPLPQIAPVLIDRYMSRQMGYRVRDYSAERHAHFGAAVDAIAATPDDDVFARLPGVISFETLCDEQYQTFAVGASVAFGLCVHMDRLCVAVKALVGETYSVPANLKDYQPFSAT